MAVAVSPACSGALLSMQVASQPMRCTPLSTGR